MNKKFLAVWFSYLYRIFRILVKSVRKLRVLRKSRGFLSWIDSFFVPVFQPLSSHFLSHFFLYTKPNLNSGLMNFVFAWQISFSTAAMFRIYICFAKSFWCASRCWEDFERRRSHVLQVYAIYPNVACVE